MAFSSLKVVRKKKMKRDEEEERERFSSLLFLETRETRGESGKKRVAKRRSQRGGNIRLFVKKVESP